MTDGDGGWNLFASTGKISDYLKYRKNVLTTGTDTLAVDFAVTAKKAESQKTQEKEQYERDLYGDGYGFVSDARG